MRCQQCQFENVPGESRCFKCGSVLGGQNVPVDIHPPRMSKWQGPFRVAIRRLRCLRVLPEGGIHAWMPERLKIMSGNAFLALILSIVPGLAHLIQRRFRQVLLYLILWIVFLPAGVFLYGSDWGYLLIGLAIAMHAWIAFHSALLKEHEEFGGRAFDIMFLLFFYAMFYCGIRITVFKDFAFGYTALKIPYQNVQYGDCLLARYSLSQQRPLPRGSLVLVSPVRAVIGYRTRDRWTNPNSRMIVQIVGLPGEEVQIKDTAFVVNGRTLDVNEYVIPDWLRIQKIERISVSNDSYFINTVYNVTGPGRANLNAEMINSVCQVKVSDVEARAIMIWNPLNRRGFLRSD
jgi:hypothetical protein